MLFHGWYVARQEVNESLRKLHVEIVAPVPLRGAVSPLEDWSSCDRYKKPSTSRQTRPRLQASSLYHGNLQGFSTASERLASFGQSSSFRIRSRGSFNQVRPLRGNTARARSTLLEGSRAAMSFVNRRERPRQAELRSRLGNQCRFEIQRFTYFPRSLPATRISLFTRWKQLPMIRWHGLKEWTEFAHVGREKVNRSTRTSYIAHSERPIR